MELTLTTPAILFPAVSLLLIAYTNRYLAITRLMRELKTSYEAKRNPIHLKQILVLKRREKFIRNMQIFAVASIFCCTFQSHLFILDERSGPDTFSEAPWYSCSFPSQSLYAMCSWRELLSGSNWQKWKRKN